MVNKSLIKQRHDIEQHRIRSSLSIHHAQHIQQSILSSWQRSELAQIPAQRTQAPLTTVSSQPTRLQQAIQRCQSQLHHIALQSDMVMAVADIGSTIIWTASSSQMREKAERVHFIEGGQWREDTVGTNALALSLKTKQSCNVFSIEHFMTSVQDWVCYATPIIDPYSKQMIGVIDLSTIWQRHNNPLGLLAVERCANIIQQTLAEAQQKRLFIRAFGTPQVILNGHVLALTPRQIEILVILALCPEGMNLENLHHAIYGERAVKLSTLKAEISQLRESLGGLLGSRPYRLLLEIDGDFLQAEYALDSGYFESVFALCTGTFLAKTESPFLCAWRDCLESRLSDLIFKTEQTDILLKHLAHSPDAVDAIERLIELIPHTHPIHQRLEKYQ